jgi:hypothetical protein
MFEDILHDIFQHQKSYNEKIRAEGEDQSPETWTQTYLLGLISEIDEVLGALNWKKHRRVDFGNIDRINMGFELADLTKYVFSLWEVWGFSVEEMCEYVSKKSRMLEIQRKQEFTPIPVDCPVLICDLDGTLADYRKSFVRWMASNAGIDVDDPSISLSMDIDMSMDYPLYIKLKERFESTGGYSFLLPYDDGVRTVSRLRSMYNVFLIVNTARPVKKFKRIWWDTWTWLTNQHISADKILFGAESRIILADAMSKQRPGFKVFMFEDDPELIMRSANSGIHVFVRRQPYNEKIVHPNVVIVDSYEDVDWAEYLRGGSNE